MKEILLSDDGAVLVDDVDYENIVRHTWHRITPSGSYTSYAARNIYQTGCGQKHVLMHHQIMGVYFEEAFVDHKDRNGLNNCRANLRLTTLSNNNGNRVKQRTVNGRKPTSQYKGVCWNKRMNKWRANIRKDGKQYELGYYESEVDAAKVYNIAAIEHFGDFARLNTL